MEVSLLHKDLNGKPVATSIEINGQIKDLEYLPGMKLENEKTEYEPKHSHFPCRLQFAKRD